VKKMQTILPEQSTPCQPLAHLHRQLSASNVAQL